MAAACWSEPNTKHAYRLSWISVTFTILAAFIGLYLYAATSSSLCLVYGLENCVDFLSSVVVLWRFFAPSQLDKVLELKLARREQRASVAIAFILFVLGLFVVVVASKDVASSSSSGHLEVNDDLKTQSSIVVISFFSIIIFGTLVFFKFHYAKCLNSPSLYKDGICSLIGTILSVALLIEYIITDQNPGLWWIDPVIAIVSGVAAILIGLDALYGASFRDNLPICSLQWWFSISPTSGTSSSLSSASLPPAGKTHDLEFTESVSSTSSSSPSQPPARSNVRTQGNIEVNDMDDDDDDEKESIV